MDGCQPAGKNFEMKSLIFAAGLGTRLKPLTDTMPKALVRVGGQPLLEHVLRRLQAAGFDDFVINACHFSEQIVDYVEHREDTGAHIALSIEEGQPLETGGGILAAREKILAAPGDGFLAHNVDILSDLDFAWFLSGVRPEALSTLLVSDRKTQRYFLFDDDMRLVGWTNLATGEVRSPFSDLDPSRCRRYAFAGIHYISDRIFDAMTSLGFSGRFSIVDFYLKAAQEYPIYGAVPEHLSLLDVGKLDSLAAAEEFVRALQEKR